MIYGLSFAEAESRLSCFISIGTGYPGLNPVSDDVWKLFQKTMISIVAETESTAQEFEETHSTLSNTWHRSSRFNVDHGLESVGLDEWNHLSDIQAKPRYWLRKTSNETK